MMSDQRGTGPTNRSESLVYPPRASSLEDAFDVVADTRTRHVPGLVGLGSSAQAVIDEVAFGIWGTWLQFQASVHRIPGIQASYSTPDLRKGVAIGLANREQRVPLSDDHTFRMASQSKVITAIAILKLVEQSRLRLEETVGSVARRSGLAFDTPFMEAIANVTIAELLTHEGSVVRELPTADYLRGAVSFPTWEVVQRSVGSNARVANVHGKKYSEVGYVVLGKLIEAISGKPYAEFVGEQLFRPLGLRGISTDVNRRRMSDCAQGYPQQFDPTADAYPMAPTEAFAPAIGTMASTGTMCTLYQSLLPGSRHGLLRSESKALLFPTLQGTEADDALSTAERRSVPVSMGFSTVDSDRPDLYGKTGALNGHVSYVLIDPSRRRVIVVAASSYGADAKALAVAGLRLREQMQSLSRDQDPILNRWASTSIRGVHNRWFSDGQRLYLGAVLGERAMLLDPTSQKPQDGAITLSLRNRELVFDTTNSSAVPVGEPAALLDESGNVSRLRGATGMSLYEVDFPGAVQVGVSDSLRARAMRIMPPLGSGLPLPP